MLYQSTRAGAGSVTSAEAIAKGLAPDGGLYVPESFPAVSHDEINKLTAMPYADRAAYITGMYLTDFSSRELSEYSRKAYNIPVFSKPAIAPVHKLDSNTYFLELRHGPTAAFKDMALQLMPRLLTASMAKINETRDVCILVATSGDTGKAALDGFKDIAKTKIMVFYPSQGVSAIQKLQMTSQEGSNVNVTGIEGNFDDAQRGVKDIFSDAALREHLSSRHNTMLSSANSINWGRLVPQIAYYFSAYCELIKSDAIKCGERVNFCVPTGNFGNILAAYYAERMGLPVGRLICASNRNNVLTDFLSTGTYDRNRPFYTTLSPSMDILISSNLERLLFELSGKDGKAVSGYMSSLNDKGSYSIAEASHAEAARIFAGGYCSEEETMSAIKKTFDEYKYLIDTHTAVAYKVLLDYRERSGDMLPAVVVSTASPYKFCRSILQALGRTPGGDDIGLIDTLNKETGIPVPDVLSALRGSKPRFENVISPADMKDSLLEFLG